MLAAWTVVALDQSDAGEVVPFYDRYCFRCHSGNEPNGDVNLKSMLAEADLTAQFDAWQRVSLALETQRMPPEGEAQPTVEERRRIDVWYQRVFVDSVKARPAEFRPRRLSATEYRKTLRSLFGFDLEVAVVEAEQTVAERSLVMKLLPTDPPGNSGFQNDTYGNPLTATLLGHYSYLADSALDELFTAHRHHELTILAGRIPANGFSMENAERLIRNFVPRAYRRDVPEISLAKMIAVARESSDVVATTKRELKVVLMSPQFLYRGLLMQAEPGRQQPVDDFELAERLSYFLWGDMPDAELMRLARNGRISIPEVLESEVDRMLNSPRAAHLAEDFAVQWLALDQIDDASNNPPVAQALKSQPIDFFHYLIAENRPLLELIDSDTAFVNPLTRKFYPESRGRLVSYRRPTGIEIEAVPNQRIQLEPSEQRGGLLTMPGVLAMNRGPVLRGTWILERILGEHLPEPPPNVGVVAASPPGEDLSFRQRFEQHRSDSACAACHDQIDPLGFAMQNYDSEGHVRGSPDIRRKKKADSYDGGEIDTSGRLPTGETFQDVEQLKQILISSQQEKIVRNLVERCLSYALCRRLELFDQPTLEEITQRLLDPDATLRDLIHEIVNSLPFRETIVTGETP